jgi:hypothetical protein
LNGKVLVTGGYSDGQVILNSAELYDPSTETSTSIDKMNNARNNRKAPVLINENFLINGRYNDTVLSSTHI